MEKILTQKSVRIVYPFFTMESHFYSMIERSLSEKETE